MSTYLFVVFVRKMNVSNQIAKFDFSFEELNLNKISEGIKKFICVTEEGIYYYFYCCGDFDCIKSHSNPFSFEPEGARENIVKDTPEATDTIQENVPIVETVSTTTPPPGKCQWPVTVADNRRCIS